MADQPTEPQAGAESPYKGRSGLRRVINAFGYSMSGLAAAYRNEAAFRQEVLLAAVLVPLALFLPASGPGRALMVGSVMLVLVVELLNSAVETVADAVSLDAHPLIGRAKDLGSAAVLLSLLLALATWVVVLWP